MNYKNKNKREKWSVGLILQRNNLLVLDYLIRPYVLPRDNLREMKMLHLLQSILKQLRNCLKGRTLTIEELFIGVFKTKLTQ